MIKADVMAAVHEVLGLYFSSETTDGKSWQRDSHAAMVRLRALADGGSAQRLAWLRDLPEAGVIAEMSSKEVDMLERRAGLLRQIAAIDERLISLRADAERQAAKGWTSAEIAAAKADKVSP